MSSMAATTCRRLKDFFTELMSAGLHCGLRVALALGMLVGVTSGVRNAPLAAATDAHVDYVDCTTAPEHIMYGGDANQFGELRVPPGPGPHPVAVIIHGGCWLNIFGLDLMDHASDALTAAGLATWNIEYRRLGDLEGGYPNTFTDVGLAIDTVRDLAPHCNLDLGKVITVGHSAGGHLGVWAAARHRLPPDHPLRGSDPLPLFAVVSLAGILNLAESVEMEVCGDLAEQLLGGPQKASERYAETSPSELVPLGVRQVLIHGTSDAIVPLMISQHYRRVARAAGDRHVQLKKIHDGDHFDVIDPSSSKWPQVIERIVDLVR
jgi:acetyl esterase/lipase